MKRSGIIIAAIVSTILMILATPFSVMAEPKMKTFAELKLEKTPIDISMSTDGRRLFVLTDDNKVKVYTNTGLLDETLPVDPGVKGIQAGRDNNILYLMDQEKKSIRIIYFISVKNIDISEAPVKGKADAPVTVVIFSEFQCPYCKKVGPILDQLLEKYPDQVKIAFKHYPLEYHDMAKRAAAAAVAAKLQGKFWEMHDKLYEHIEYLTDEKITDIAKGLGLNMEKFKVDWNKPETEDRVLADKEDGREAAVSGTPTIFINGKQQESSQLKALIAAVRREITPSAE